MVMSSRQIVEMISKPQLTGTDRGALLFESRDPARVGHGRAPHTPRQMQFLRDLGENAGAVAAQAVRHPGQGARGQVRDPNEPLTASELAWLQRFPSPVDPAAVSFEDAQALSSMSSVSAMKHPADARLVESLWAPVREYHDRREAEAAMDHARQPMMTVPSSVVGALHDAISAEVPGLEPHEIAGRADALMRQASEQRNRAHSNRVAEAEELHRRVDAKTTQRTAVNL